MEWNAETDMLKRIMALLVALAGLADRAGTLSHPVRCLVLGILRPAEAVARAFVIRSARGAPLPAQACAMRGLMVAREGDDAADATRLALQFRALALALAGLLACAGWSDRRPANSPAVRPGLHTGRALHALVNALRGSGLRITRHPCPDTS